MMVGRLEVSQRPDLKKDYAKQLFAFLFCFNLLPGIVQASKPAQVEAMALAKKIEISRKNIQAGELKQRKVLSSLFSINKRIKKSVTDRGAFSQQRAVTEYTINSISKKASELATKTKSQKSLLAVRLKAIYKLGSPSIARYVFAAENSYVLDRNLKILGIIAERDLELIKNYSYDLKDLQSKKRALAVRLESLKIIEAKIFKQESMLKGQQVLKAKLLEGIRKNKMFAMTEIKGLREKSLKAPIEDAGVFDLLFKPSFSDQKGHLPQPIEGLVTRRFGLIKGKDHPYTISNRGIVISAGENQTVKSVFEGKVSYVGEIPGLGKTLILDHGDHYYTVYGNTQAVQVVVGDEVKQSQVIASAGDNKSELYFEIRHFSEPYDPQLWMKGF